MEAPADSCDAELAAALAGGSPDALAAVYDRFSDRLYSYAVTLVHNPDAAADAVADTFLLAHSRIGQLRDGERLRSWLYAICRNECMRYHRDSARSTHTEDFDDMTGPEVDLDAPMQAAAAVTLVAAALPGLNDNDREVIELAMRHDFDSRQIGEALGVNVSNASARVSRAKAQLQRCIGALVLFRSRGRDCAELAAIVQAAPGFDALTRKRIARHIEQCPECDRVKKSAVLEIAMASALPMMAAPTSLRERLVSAQSEGAADILGADRPPFDRNGWPARAGNPGRHLAMLVAGCAAGLVALFALGTAGLGNADRMPGPASNADTGPNAPLAGATRAGSPLTASPRATASKPAGSDANTRMTPLTTVVGEQRPTGDPTMAPTWIPPAAAEIGQPDSAPVVSDTPDATSPWTPPTDAPQIPIKDPPKYNPPANDPPAVVAPPTLSPPKEWPPAYDPPKYPMPTPK